VKAQSVAVAAIARRVEDKVLVESAESYLMAGLLNHGRGMFSRQNLRGTETKYKSLNRVAERQLIYSKLFGWEGSITIVPSTMHGRLVSPEFPTYQLDENRVDPPYIGHAVCSQSFMDQLSAATTGIGQRRQRVNPCAFEQLILPLPPLPDQRRIAAHLDAIATVAARKHLESPQARSAIDALVEQLPWASSVAAHMWLDLDEIKVTHAARYRSVGLLNKGRGVLDRGLIMGSETKYSSFNRVRGGQVLLSRLKAFEGAVAVVPSELEGSVASKEFPTFSIFEDSDPGFVKAVLRSPRFTSEMHHRSVGIGARRERLSAQAFLETAFPAATAGVQTRIGNASDLAIRADRARIRSNALASALVPAARNEIFSSLR